MHKILALYINEMTKISRKISVIIILGIMVILVIGIAAITKFTSNVSSSSQYMNYTNMQQSLDAQLNSLNSKLTDLQKKEASASESELASLKSQEEALQAQIDMLQYAVDNDIPLYSNSYRATALQNLFTYKAALKQLKNLPSEMLTSDQKKELVSAQDYVDRLTSAIENQDFDAYIDVSNDIINNNTSLNDGEKKIGIDVNNLKKKIKLTGESDGQANLNDNSSQIIATITNDKYSLLYNYDFNSADKKPLTQQDRQKKIDGIAVSTYKLENNLVVDGTASVIAVETQYALLYVGTMMLVILMLILAGSTVSNEMSTGSIKSLIIAPVRRWKIWLSKLLSLFTVLIISGLFMYAVTLLAYGMFFGFDSLQPYVFSINGTAYGMSYYLFYFGKLFVYLLQVLIYTIFAFMLSIITRNTAASVGISIAVYFGGSISSSIILALAKGEWVKFIPFRHFDLTAQVFLYDPIITMQGTQTTAGTSLMFSLINVAVLLLLMGYTAFDSFTRRDIK